MNEELIVILADAIKEYYQEHELEQVCALFDVEVQRQFGPGGDDVPDYLELSTRLIVHIDHGNHRRFLETVIPNLQSRCAESVAKTAFEKREYHEQMERQLWKLMPLLGTPSIPAEITVAENQPFSAKSVGREFIARAETDVTLVDPYVGVGTLDCLREVTHSVRLLTGNRRNAIERDFDRHLRYFSDEGHDIEVRQHPELHDRYILFNDKCWLVGSSLKDAGKKRLNIIECIDTKEWIRDEVEKKWKEAAIYSP